MVGATAAFRKHGGGVTPEDTSQYAEYGEVKKCKTNEQTNNPLPPKTQAADGITA